MNHRIVAVLTWLALLTLRLPLHAAEVTVFAAASLTESLNEIAAAYETQSTDRIIFNFGASSTLARQIEEGAPADIFFSADEAKMDRLEGKGLILKETRKSFLSNSLVIVVAADGGAMIESPKDLATDKVKRLALAEPNSVPAGIYAREYLEKQHLWSAVEAKVVPTENVRGALAAVEAGNVEAGIVYKTDAAISRKVKVACQIPARDTPDIHYPAAVVRGSKRLEAAKAFLEYLATEEAGKVFERHGFVVRKPGSPP
jgi:molybdate transport system substrate-binding protein